MKKVMKGGISIDDDDGYDDDDDVDYITCHQSTNAAINQSRC